MSTKRRTPLQQVIYEDLWLSSDKLDWDGELWILAAKIVWRCPKRSCTLTNQSSLPGIACISGHNCINSSECWQPQQAASSRKKKALS